MLSGADSANFEGFGTYVIDPGGRWTLTGANMLTMYRSVVDKGSLTIAGTLDEAAGAVIMVNGFMTVTGPGESFAGAISGSGSVVFRGGDDTFAGADLTAARMVVAGAAITLEGSITLATVLSVASSNMVVGAGGATLSGGGTLALNNFASNRIIGAAASDVLSLASAILSGAGMLGGGQMVLINRSDGVIDGNGQNALIIDTGASQIATSGLIEAAGAGGVMIQSAVLNRGRLEAAGGILTVNGAVTGPHGTGVIAAGALVFNSTFAESVMFTGTSGMLGLAKSQTYTGAITGFSKTGGTSLDLGDIAFVSASEATYSGTATSGVLTVTDGAHTARITLLGNYLSSTFTTSSDGHGGTIVVDPPKATTAATAPVSQTPDQFIAAMAGLGGVGGAAIHTSTAWSARAPVLVKPHVMIA